MPALLQAVSAFNDIATTLLSRVVDAIEMFGAFVAGATDAIKMFLAQAINSELAATSTPGAATATATTAATTAATATTTATTAATVKAVASDSALARIGVLYQRALEQLAGLERDADAVTIAKLDAATALATVDVSALASDFDRLRADYKRVLERMAALEAITKTATTAKKTASATKSKKTATVTTAKKTATAKKAVTASFTRTNESIITPSPAQTAMAKALMARHAALGSIPSDTVLRLISRLEARNNNRAFVLDSPFAVIDVVIRALKHCGSNDADAAYNRLLVDFLTPYKEDRSTRRRRRLGDDVKTDMRSKLTAKFKLYCDVQ